MVRQRSCGTHVGIASKQGTTTSPVRPNSPVRSHGYIIYDVLLLLALTICYTASVSYWSEFGIASLVAKIYQRRQAFKYPLMPPTARYWRATGGYQDIPALTSPPTRIWRANGGYQDVEIPPTATPQQQSAMYWPPWYCTQWAGQQYVRGPVPVNGVCSYPQGMPPQYWSAPYGCVPPWQPGVAGDTPPPPYQAPPAVEENKAEHTKDKKDEEEGRVENPDAPPQLDEGVNYMFDKSHTMLHIFNKAAPIWEEKYQKQELKFKIFKTPVSFTPTLIIEKVLRKEGDDCKGWAVTEAHERGGGVWAKGMTIKYTSDKAGDVLPKFGWSTKRGGALPPVWLVVHEV